MSDGTPFDATNLLKDGANPFFENNDYNKPVRDPRLYETMWVNGDSYGDHAAEFWIGGRDNQTSTSTGTGSVATGFSLAKFFKLGSISCYPQWPYLRLAEVYLIYAEALLYHGDLAGAIQQVDKVRARVGLGGLAECNPTKNLTTDKDALLKQIDGLYLIRNFAKVNVHASLDNFQIEGFVVLNNTTAGTVAPYLGKADQPFANFDLNVADPYAAVADEQGYVGNRRGELNDAVPTTFTNEAKYVYERPQVDTEDPAYILVKAHYTDAVNEEESGTYFYKIDIVRQDPNTMLNTIGP